MARLHPTVEDFDAIDLNEAFDRLEKTGGRRGAAIPCICLGTAITLLLERV